MNYDGMIFINKNALSSSWSQQQRAILVAHEVSHQWFYALVGNDQVKEPWLSEGLACWSAQLYGRQAGIIQSPSQHISDHLAWPLTAFSNHSEYMSAIYNGGQFFWDEIENKAGQVKLYHGLHEYVKQYSGKVASTKDLFETLQKCGVDSKLLIHTWPGKPPIN